MEDWRKWGMLEEEAESALVNAGACVPGHHRFSAGAHANMKVICRRLSDPGNELIRDRLDRALVYKILRKVHDEGLMFKHLIGPDSGGQAMVRRIAPVLSGAMGREIMVLTNCKLVNGDFEITEQAELLATCHSALMLEDVITTGGSLGRLRAALQKVSPVVITGIFAFVNREGQEAESLGVQAFSALVDKPMPSYDVERGVECPLCAAGIPMSSHH